MKKVIITGVSGQDGSYMVEHILKNTDYSIIGVVRRSAKPDLGNLDNVISNPRFALSTADLSDSTSVSNLVIQEKPDYFINLGAQSFVGSSWSIPEQTFDVNSVGVIRCLEAILKHAPKCRFYNAGSSEEFGDVQYCPQDEKHPLRARSIYGASKIAARQIVKVYRESYGLFAIQGTLFNHESERRGVEFVTRKITKGVARIKYAIENGMSFEPIELGNLESKRDWSHAEDFVEGIWLMLNRDKPSEYILASGEAHSIRDFIEHAFNAAGIPLEDANKQRFEICKEDVRCSQINYIHPLTKEVLVTVSPLFYRPAEVDLLCGNSELAREELKWEPKINFQTLVQRMVDNDILLTENKKKA